jgi:hypothetical protein
MVLPFLQRGFPPIVADLYNGHGSEPLLDVQAACASISQRVTLRVLLRARTSVCEAIHTSAIFPPTQPTRFGQRQPSNQRDHLCESRFAYFTVPPIAATFGLGAIGEGQE